MRLLLLLFTVIDWLIDWLIDQTFIISISKEIMQKLTLELDPMCYYIPLLLPVIHYLQNLRILILRILIVLSRWNILFTFVQTKVMIFNWVELKDKAFVLFSILCLKWSAHKYFIRFLNLFFFTAGQRCYICGPGIMIFFSWTR